MTKQENLYNKIFNKHFSYALSSKPSPNDLCTFNAQLKIIREISFSVIKKFLFCFYKINLTVMHATDWLWCAIYIFLAPSVASLAVKHNYSIFFNNLFHFFFPLAVENNTVVAFPMI